MIVYILIFVLSSILLYYSVVSDKIENKRKLLLAAILVPCIFAGLRGITIGTDLQVYVSQLFESSIKSNGIIGYFNKTWYNSSGIMHVYDYEYAFSILMFILARVTRNFNLVLFFIQVLIQVPLFLAVKNFFKNEKKQYLTYILILLTMYNFSFNAIRQSIGVAFCIYAFSLVYKENNYANNKKFILITILSFLFHKSSLLILIPYLFFQLLKNNNQIINIKGKTYKLNFIIIDSFLLLLFLFVINSQWIVYILNFFKLNKFSLYLSGTIDFKLTIFLRTIPVIGMIIYILYKIFKLNEKKEKNNLFLRILIAHFLLLILATKTIYAIRIVNIFEIIECIIYMDLLNINLNIDKLKLLIIDLFKIDSYKINGKFNIEKMMFILYIIYCIVSWIIFYPILNSSETIPYKFFWQ